MLSKPLNLGACAPWRVVLLRLAIVAFAVLCASNVSEAQTEAVLQGRVLDASGAVLRAAAIRVRNDSGFAQFVLTDLDGHYRLAAVPAGTYHVVAEAAGFRSEVIEALEVDVGRTLVRDFVLKVGEQTDSVVVRGEVPLIDRATATLGHVVTEEIVRQVPPNGRHFADLGLLVPGSVSPSQNGFSSRSLRGLGALAFNTAGNREESVGFIVNGVSTNNLTFGSLIFEPAIASIQEFKVDNSAFGAEHGHVSGAIVNMVTRSGGDVFTGDAFEFFRDDALDARNFFEFTSSDPHPFRRHQFGGSLGGPIRRGRTFFFASYEGVRHRQGVDLNSLVLSDAERAAAELGLRYEWHVTPTERNDEFVVFDAPRASLVRVGVDVDRIYRQNNRNVEPRVGVAWILSDDGDTVVRVAYGRAVDQPGTSMVRDTAGNPPFGVPLSATGAVSLASALEATRPVALAPFTVDPGFRNASSQSWNVNLQHQLGPSMAATIGYLGSHGADLRISRNLNQPVNGVRPFPALSAFSPILPGVALGAAIP